MPQFHLEVVIFGLRSKLYFLDLDRVLPSLGFLGALLLFVLIAAPVHEADYRRSGIRGDFDHVQAAFGRIFAGDFQRHHAELFSIGGDQPDRADSNLFVYSGFL